ncbi:MAG TPA: serine/threonine-protein kinase [Kofleriaceae bacterium]
MAGCQLCGADHDGGPEACPKSRVGQVIANKYELVALIGAGGIAAVYEAHHRLLRRDIALKILHPRFAKDPELATRFVREARETAALGHPAFVAVHDAGVADDGCAFIEMARLEGRDLWSVRETEGVMSPARAVKVAIEVLEGLELLHKRGIVHRDLKSANIFIEAGSDRVKLLDLGFAKVTDEHAVTDPEQLLGTPLYISPEQCFDPRQVDGRADLFSLGVVLFENLTGDWPYTWTSKRELLRRVLKGDLERHPAKRRSEIPGWLDDIVARSLAFDREHRFANATEMREALQRGARSQRPSLLKRLLR